MMKNILAISAATAMSPKLTAPASTAIARKTNA